MSEIGPYLVEFAGRRSWKARVIRDDVVLETIPVAWDNTLQRDCNPQIVSVNFHDQAESQAVFRRGQPFNCALTSRKAFESRGSCLSKDLYWLFLAQPIAQKVDPNRKVFTLVCAIVGVYDEPAATKGVTTDLEKEVAIPSPV